MNRDRKGLKILLILAAVVLAAWMLHPLGETLNLGLDLQGGSHVVLEVQQPEDGVLDRDAVTRVVEIIRRRVDGLGVAEPVIQREGHNRIIVELPGIENPEEAIEAIGRTAMLEFSTEDGTVVMTGGHLTDARASYHPTFGVPIINFELNAEGRRIFARVTAENVGRRIAISLDDEILTNPVVDEPIPGGSGYIRGFESLEAAQRIAVLLRAGALPVPVEIVENRTVGPTLGRDLIESSIKAGIIGLILVGLYMILYYRAAGLVADLALLIYGLIVLGIMAGLQATLTLPGVAGFILSIGMAVDANVIIFERIKEELQVGKTLRTAISSGFKRAFGTILDSNITTLIAAAVLAYFGTGMIRGFAIILSIGILTSMFTAIVVTKTLLEMALSLTWIRKHRAILGLERGVN